MGRRASERAAPRCASLRLSDRIVQARGDVRARPKGRFPRFSSRRATRPARPLALDERSPRSKPRSAPQRSRTPSAIHSPSHYYAAPRGTHDIDLNVRLREARRTRAPTLAALGVAPAARPRCARSAIAGRCVSRWDTRRSTCSSRTTAARALRGARAPRAVRRRRDAPDFSAEDLSIFKVIFDRAKGLERRRGDLYGWCGIRRRVRRRVAAEDPRSGRTATRAHRGGLESSARVSSWCDHRPVYG